MLNAGVLTVWQLEQRRTKKASVPVMKPGDDGLYPHAIHDPVTVALQQRQRRYAARGVHMVNRAGAQ